MFQDSSHQTLCPDGQIRRGSSSAAGARGLSGTSAPPSPAQGMASCHTCVGPSSSLWSHTSIVVSCTEILAHCWCLLMANTFLLRACALMLLFPQTHTWFLPISVRMPPHQMPHRTSTSLSVPSFPLIFLLQSLHQSAGYGLTSFSTVWLPHESTSPMRAGLLVLTAVLMHLQGLLCVQQTLKVCNDPVG